MSTQLGNPYPEEFGYYRIGTPINADLNRASPACPAFEMAMLAGQNCLLTSVNPTSTKRIQGSGCDTRSQDAWGFSCDTSLTFGCFVNASLSFHVNRSSNSARSRSSQTLTAFARQEMGIELRRNVPREVLVGCATADFRKKLEAIEQAAAELKAGTGTAAALRAALADFYRVYGTGFVSKLVLGAIGLFRGSATYASSVDETRANYGGGVSVSGFFGGGSVAAEYTQNCLRSDARGTFRGEAFGMPAGSGPATWADGFLNEFAGQQLAKLGNLEPWQKSFEAPIAHAEPPKLAERPAKEPTPVHFPGDEIEAQINNMKLQTFEEQWSKAHNGERPAPQQYEHWVAELKDAARQANANDIARAAAAPAERAPLPGSGEALALVGASAFDPASLRFGAAAAADAPADGVEAMAPSPRDAGLHEGFLHPLTFGASQAAGFDDVDFGGYGVVGYEYTPWGELFPELKTLQQALTPSQLSMGYALAWLSIRGQFAQYFRFGATSFPDVVPEGTSASANAFAAALDDVSTYIVTSFSAPDFTSMSLATLEREFRARLAARRFMLMSHYELLIEHYPWLRKVPFGAVPVVEMLGRLHFQPAVTRQTVNANEQLRTIDYPAPTLLEQGALRLYPIISSDISGKPFFFWTNAEIVTIDAGTAKARNVRVGASISNDPYGRIEAVDWGMTRVYGEAGTIGTLTGRLTGDPVVPRPEAVDMPLWPLQPQPVAILLQRGQSTGAAPAFGPITSWDETWRMLCIGKDAGFTFDGYERAKVLASSGEYLDTLPVQLVPVGYDDARLATEPADGFQGGGPMWLEPRTDDIVRALHDLAA